jgi:chloramphenicol 3-O phosphotransferase
MASMKIRLRDKFFTVNLSSSSSAEMKSASAAVAPKRDSVMYVDLFRPMMKLIDYKRFFRNFTGMLGRNAECYADVVLPKLS